MVNILGVILLGAILLVLLETRISVGTRVAVMERDLHWLTASLVKWGMIPPMDRKNEGD